MKNENEVPLSSSPDPVKATSLSIPRLLPVTPPDLVVEPHLWVRFAPPVTESSPAWAENATNEPASAVSPTFLKLFINYSFIVCIHMNIGFLAKKLI